MNMHRTCTRPPAEDPLLSPGDQLVVPVVGMHRSGTSLTTRLLDLLGMELGWPLQPPSVDNQKGFWEHTLFQGVNIQVLEGLGGHPDGYGTPAELVAVAKRASEVCLPDTAMRDLKTRLSQHFMHPQWGFKDPRTAVLWPLWRRVLPQLGYTKIRPVLVVRSPGAVAQSLQRRGDVDAVAQAAGVPLITYVEQMWAAYHQILLQTGIGDLRPMVVCHEDLLNPERASVEVARLADHLGVGSDACAQAIEWIDARMDHRQPDSSTTDEPGSVLYARLVDLAGHQREGFLARGGGVDKVSLSCPEPVSKPATSHCIYVVSPLGYPGARCFDEVAESLHHGFAALGIEAPIVRKPEDIQGTPIVLGANQIGKFIDTTPAALQLPADAIIYNLEQVDESSTWMDRTYLTLLRRYRVWDYSAANVEQLAKWGIVADGICGIGHVAALERIPVDGVKDIDVLFYGSLNERRMDVLEALKARGLRVVVSTNLYGAGRDSLVARAKVVLNVHYYPAKVLEVVRLSYLMANRCAVVSETGANPAEEAPFRDAIAFAAYDQLVQRCVALVDDPVQARLLAERARSVMRSRPQSQFLAELLK